MKNNLQTIQNQTEFFQTNGVKIAFDSMSTSNLGTHRQILFLINGFQRTRHDFRAFRQKIIHKNSDLITISFDNRFCGETQIIDNFDNNINHISLLDFAQDALNLLLHCMDKFQTKQAHVLGISMGGMIAQILASLPNCPKLKTLFLVSTTAGGPHRVWPEPSFLQKNERETDVDEISFEDKLALFFGKKFLKSSPLLFKMFVQNMKNLSQQENNTKNAKMQQQATKNFEGIEDFTSLKAENVVIITGDEDHIMPLKNSENLQTLIPKSHLIIYPGIGHLILIENSNEFVHDVLSYSI